MALNYDPPPPSCPLPNPIRHWQQYLIGFVNNDMGVAQVYRKYIKSPL